MALKELKNYITKTPPSDYFEEENKTVLKILPWISVSGILFFFLLMLFDSAYLTFSITYIVIGLLGLIFNMFELLSRKKTPWGASASLTTNTNLAIIYGSILGLIVAMPNLMAYFMTGALLFSTGSSAMTQMGFWGALLVVGLLIPLIEMNFYARVLVPSMMQLGGVVAGVVIPTVFFVLSHYGTYGLSLFPLTLLALFRIGSSIGIMDTKNYLTALIPHIMLNVTGVFVWQIAVILG